MSASDDDSTSGPLTLANGRRRLRDDVLQLGPRKKVFVVSFRLSVALKKCLYRCISSPLVHFGRHFGRTIHALCNVNALLTNGLLRLGTLADEDEESFTVECVVFCHDLCRAHSLSFSFKAKTTLSYIFWTFTVSAWFERSNSSWYTRRHCGDCRPGSFSPLAVFLVIHDT